MPQMMRFGPGKTADKTGAGGLSWFDIDMAIDADRDWLMAWQEINEQTRQALLEPVRFNHYEQVPDGTLLSIKTLHPGQTDDVTDLADLKLLIGSTSERSMEPGSIRDAGLTSDVKEAPEGPSKHIETLPDTELGRQDQSDAKNVHKHCTCSRTKLVGVHAFALLLALGLFLFHVVIILDVAGGLIHREAWLLAHFGQHAGKVILLGSFFVLFAAHLAEYAAWGLFLRGARLMQSVTEGIYFTAASLTTLGDLQRIGIDSVVLADANGGAQR